MDYLFKNSGFSLEFRVLLAFLKTFIYQKQDKELTELCKRLPNWEEVLRLIKHHRVSGHVSKSLNYLNKSEMPAKFIKPLSIVRKNDLYRIFKKIRMLISIHELFRTNGLQFLTIKGPILSLQLFDDIALRNSSDLDILVPENQAQQSFELLRSNGFTQTWPPPGLSPKKLAYFKKNVKDFVFQVPGDIWNVEVHWKSEGPQNFSRTYDLFERPSLVTAQGKAFQTLNPPRNIIYLAWHGYKHGWARLHWLLDILTLKGEILQFEPELKRHPLYFLQAADQLSEKLFEASFLPDSLRAKKDYSSAVLVKTEKYLSVDQNVLLYRALIAPSALDKINCALSILKPKAAESIVELSDALLFMRHFFRPFWIIRRFIRRQISA